MSLLQHVAIVAIVIVVALVVVFVVDWGPPPIVQPVAPIESRKTPILFEDSLPKPFLDPGEFPGSVDEPIVRAEVPANIREIERSRRAQRPAFQKRNRPYVATYDAALEDRTRDGTFQRPKPAEPMPPTSCRSVESAPKHSDKSSGPYSVHDHTVWMFETESGFGYYRLLYKVNSRGIRVTSWSVDRVELVSLLTDDVPSAYVLDEMATPPLARQAKRRPLDQFERLGLDAVRRGEHLVWTPEAPKRMFGAIRARTQCLECHVNAKRGDLLGGFTYYLEVPVDELAKREAE